MVHSPLSPQILLGIRHPRKKERRKKEWQLRARCGGPSCRSEVKIAFIIARKEIM